MRPSLSTLARSAPVVVAKLSAVAAMTARAATTLLTALRALTALTAVAAASLWPAGAAQAQGATRAATLVVAPVDPAGRVALVVGISAYAGNPLPNPGLDAAAMQRQLAGLQPRFDVITPQSLTRPGILAALGEFKSRLRGAAVGFFYFAGHGMEIDGQNYLIPLGVDMSREDDVRYNAIAVDDVLKALEGVPARIVVLDACRNNPFQRGGAGGLAPTVGTTLQGTLIAYATSPRRVALDGQPGRNGLYTASLLAAMQQPGVGIEEVFKRTRIAVAEASQGRQIPWESTSLTGTLVLQPGPAAVAAAVAGASAGSAPSALAMAARGTGPWRPLEAFSDGCAGCPEMVVLPAGPLRMGSPDGEAGRHPREGPLQELRVPQPLAVGRREVTLAEYRACVLDARRPGDEPDLLCTHWPRTEGAGAADSPVVDISWEDAQTYVRWLSRRTGRLYRLLSEAEWEYAARAGSATARPWGDALGEGLAVCADCSAAGRPAGPRPAPLSAPLSAAPSSPRSSPPSSAPASPFAAASSALATTPSLSAAAGQQAGHPWGLQNMLGNVWEWVEDCRNDSLQGQPTLAQPRLSGDCAERGIRGGSWRTRAKGVRSASRAFLPVRQREQHVGFRVALTLEPGQLARP
jgi:formylglycine-generating enzyme required for sulfatase activity